MLNAAYPCCPNHEVNQDVRCVFATQDSVALNNSLLYQTWVKIYQETRFLKLLGKTILCLFSTAWICMSELMVACIKPEMRLAFCLFCLMILSRVEIVGSEL